MCLLYIQADINLMKEMVSDSSLMPSMKHGHSRSRKGAINNIGFYIQINVGPLVIVCTFKPMKSEK